jgi:hypothetical protein
MKMKALRGTVRPSRMIWIAAISILALSFNISYAQDVATGSAQGTVVPLIVVTAVQPLDFGNIYQGVAHTITEADDDSSAIFNITGQAGAGINLQLILPEYLALADGSDRMPITFSTTDAAVDTNDATPSTIIGADGWINQNPYILPAAAVIGDNGAPDNTRIYLGGRVDPSTNQKAGAYTGDIVLMVAYRDN